MPKYALLIVDVQNDFCPGGALPVPRGDEVVAALNRYIDLAVQAKLPIYASRDWHPKKTTHFAPYGGTWPVHCVQHSDGAAFHPDLKLPAGAEVISKGMDSNAESYSCFQGTTLIGMPFLEVLKRDGIQELFVGGLATDYCVKAAVLDARKHRFDVTVLSDAIREVNLKVGDVEHAIREMECAGATFATFETIYPRLGVPIR